MTKRWPAGSFLRRPRLTAAIASIDAARALPASPRRRCELCAFPRRRLPDDRFRDLGPVRLDESFGDVRITPIEQAGTDAGDRSRTTARRPACAGTSFWRVARQTSSTVASPAFVSARARGASAGVVTPFVRNAEVAFRRLHLLRRPCGHDGTVAAFPRRSSRRRGRRRQGSNVRRREPVPAREMTVVPRSRLNSIST